MKLCMTCKHFGISHPLVNLYNSPEATQAQKQEFVRGTILTHGFCMRADMVNPVTGDPTKRLAMHERDWGACGPSAIFFEPSSSIGNDSASAKSKGESDETTQEEIEK